MLLFIGVLTAAAAILTTVRMRPLGRTQDANLGRISEQWLAEHRAANPS